VDVERRYAPARPLADAVFDTDQDDRPVVEVRQLGSDDTQDAGMPGVGGKHDGADFFRSRTQSTYSTTSLKVDCSSSCRNLLNSSSFCESEGLIPVFGQEQPHGVAGGGNASGSVQSRDYRKRECSGIDRAFTETAYFSEGLEADPFPTVDEFKADL